MLYKQPSDNIISDNITFIITDDCNLQCKYCYEKNKWPNYMQLKIAIQCVDYFFNQWKQRQNIAVFDFMGGEPFLAIDLISKIVPYIIDKNEKTKKWENIMFSFSTNGTQFVNPKVKEFIQKYWYCISVGLSLDGCKIAHNINRCNSFDIVMNQFNYWINVFPNGGTKSTINHESLPYLFESIKFLHSTKLQYMYMNTVYENIWQKNDDKLFYEQLIKSADYIIDNNLYKTKYCSLFDIYTMQHTNIEHHNWCGCGSSMIAVDYQGNLYPCTRFKTLSKQKPLVIGTVYDKIDYKKLLPFYFCHNIRKSPDCKNCEASTSCPNCTAFCYDETNSIFNRLDYMCNMHKANIYYWNKLANKEHVTIKELYNLGGE